MMTYLLYLLALLVPLLLLKLSIRPPGTQRRMFCLSDLIFSFILKGTLVGIGKSESRFEWLSLQTLVFGVNGLAVGTSSVFSWGIMLIGPCLTLISFAIELHEKNRTRVPVTVLSAILMILLVNCNQYLQQRYIKLIILICADNLVVRPTVLCLFSVFLFQVSSRHSIKNRLQIVTAELLGVQLQPQVLQQTLQQIVSEPFPHHKQLESLQNQNSQVEKLAKSPRKRKNLRYFNEQDKQNIFAKKTCGVETQMQKALDQQDIVLNCIDNLPTLQVNQPQYLKKKRGSASCSNFSKVVPLDAHLFQSIRNQNFQQKKNKKFMSINLIDQPIFKKRIKRRRRQDLQIKTPNCVEQWQPQQNLVVIGGN